MSPHSSNLVDRAEIARLLGVTERHIHRLVEGGMPRRVHKNDVLYPDAECLAWYRRQKAEEAVARAQPSEPKDIDEARARKESALAEKAELEVALLRSELIRMDSHTRVVAAIADAVRGWTQAIPGRWTPRLPGRKRETMRALQLLVAEAVDDLNATVEALGTAPDEDADAA